MVVRQLRLYGNFQVAPDSSRVSTNVSGGILDRSVKYSLVADSSTVVAGPIFLTDHRCHAAIMDKFSQI